jgi:hypothetical protein
MQDSTDAFSGLLVQLSAEQAGLLSAGAGFLPAVGNVVRVEGIVGHTLGNTVLEQVSAVTLVSPRVALPTPVPVTGATLASGYPALDAVLPGAGWPLDALSELLQPPGLTALQSLGWPRKRPLRCRRCRRWKRQ